MKLIDLFNSTIKSASEIPDDGEFVFSNNVFPDIPQELDSEISIAIRMIRRGNGSMDNLLMKVSKQEVFALGLWIIGAFFQKKYKSYSLNLNYKMDDGHYIQKLEINLENSNQPLDLNVSQFKWIPTSVENFVTFLPPYYNQRPYIVRTCEHKDYCNCTDWDLKVLKGFGNLAASFFAAEFFLNLGWKHSDINFEYFKDSFNPSIGSDDSCEMRVELLEASNFILNEVLNQKIN
jgi:hypothetical protein